MAKKKAPSPAAVAKQQAAIDRKLEAQKIQSIQEAAFEKGKHMALRAAAKRAGYEAGLKAAGVQPVKAKKKPNK